MKVLTLSLLPVRLAVCRLPPEAPLPEVSPEIPFVCLTRTGEEISMVLPEETAPAGSRVEWGWRAFKVLGPLDFDMTGVLASISVPLAMAGVSVFVLSSYDTDYFLVRERDLDKAVEALSGIPAGNVTWKTPYRIVLERE
ncbi:MAG: ACT domain-containing protein [Deltaproteobacteria bacterium]|nr:ACT domain-containing protein [Deltaproteobacteria bacterium]